jgi:hypothetical protein
VNQANRTVMSMRLLPQHAALRQASAIPNDVARARGYRSVAEKPRRTELGFSWSRARVSARLIPIWNVDREIATNALRLSGVSWQAA